MKIYNLNLFDNSTEYVELGTRSGPIKFLIDTQAEISLIKMNALPIEHIVLTSNKTKLTGITDGFVKSLGSTTVDLLLDEALSINFELQVVSKNFPIPFNGILGRDFIKKYKCTICALYYELTIRVGIDSFIFPFKTVDIWLPPRSQCIRKINVKWVSDKVSRNISLRKGVFSATTIVSKENPQILLMNTTCRPTKIRLNELEFDELTDYDILHCSKSK